MIRAVKSVTLPAANEVTMVTVREGHDSDKPGVADATNDPMNMPNTAIALRNFTCVSSPVFSSRFLPRPRFDPRRAGHGLPSRLDRRLSQGARGHPPRSNEIHETPMSKIQEVARPGRTAISGYSAATLL
jgi:hypothetical protein